LMRSFRLQQQTNVHRPQDPPCHNRLWQLPAE
jgi:hypothetical protein